MQEIKKLIAKEEFIYNDFDIGKMRFFLYNLKNGNIDDMKYCKALIIDVSVENAIAND
ncbi:MAG: hypothetical protein FWB91_14340 [Defluviitaleaceae bacterium]|nr:hypothetical protein [Defluviitaleaceae bacterium]